MNVKIGIVPLLTIVFMTLKLCNVIDWSWWWVFSPVIVVVILLALLGVLWVFSVIAERSSK